MDTFCFPQMPQTMAKKVQLCEEAGKVVFVHVPLPRTWVIPIPAQPTRQPRMQPPSNLGCNLPSTFPKHFSQAPSPIKISKHFPQPPRPPPFPSTNPSPAHPATSHATSQALFPSTPAHQNFQALFPSGAPNQMSKDFFFGPCDFPALAQNCTLQFTTNSQKKFSGIVKVQQNFRPRGFGTCGRLSGPQNRTKIGKKGGKLGNRGEICLAC